MTTVALKASLALWKRRYAARVKLRTKARQDILEARDADTHPRQALVDRKILREQQAEEARKAIISLEKQIAAKGTGVRRPFERVKMNVACQSSRNGVRPNLIVLHDTEGANVPGIADLESLGAWFDRITTQASSNVGVDSAGNAAKFVPDAAKAWAQATFNSRALSIEQIGHASQQEWPEPQLRKTAQYLAFWNWKYGIPLVHSTASGVCQHSDLGAAGGGHVDCGPSYPFDRVLDMARDFRRNGW
jgi:hypothetical protein